jgi:hypothetical protein
VFSLCLLNCDIAFKITNRLKVNNNIIKLYDNFKIHIKVRLKKYLENIRRTSIIIFFVIYYFTIYFLI